MSTIIYHDLVRGCLTAAQKLYLAAGGDNTARWRLELDGQTAGIARDQYGVWTLALPLLPLDTRMTRQEQDYWTGYVVHEAGHAVFTDFQVWKDAIRLGVADLVNALEDVRQEREIIANNLAKNARPLFEALCAHNARKGLDAGWKPGAHDRNALAFTLCMYGRVLVSGYTIAELPALDAATASALAWIWPELAACANTQAVLQLALKIRSKTLSQQGQQGQQGKGQQGEGQQGEGQQGEGQQGEGQQGKGQQGKGQQGKSKSPNVSGKQRGGNAFGLSGLETDLQELAQAARNRSGAQLAERMRGDKRLAEALAPIVSVETNPAYYASRCKQFENLFPSLAKLKADLTRLVRSPERIGTQGGLLHGRLDGGALVRSQTGAEDCFLRRDIVEGVNTAVAVILDGSSSMGSKGKAEYAHGMALAIGDALDRAAVSFEVSVTGVGQEFEACIYKPFGGAWRKHRGAVGARRMWGGTCNLIGAQSAVDRLLRVRDASRRIVFVLSDGQDCFGDREWLRVQELWALKGVETIGVGLLHDVSDCFPVCVNVTSPEQLAREGLGVLVRKLRAAA